MYGWFSLSLLRLQLFSLPLVVIVCSNLGSDHAKFMQLQDFPGNVPCVVETERWRVLGRIRENRVCLNLELKERRTAVKEVNRKRVGKEGAGRVRRQLRPMARAIESSFRGQAEPLLPVLGMLLDTQQTVDEVLAAGRGGTLPFPPGPDAMRVASGRGVGWG